MWHYLALTLIVLVALVLVAGAYVAYAMRIDPEDDEHESY